MITADINLQKLSKITSLMKNQNLINLIKERPSLFLKEFETGVEIRTEHETC